MGKLGILAVGAILIIGVLFIGYKMDNVEPKSPARKAPKAPKKKTKVKNEYMEEKEDKKEENLYPTPDVSEIPYENDDNEYYEEDNVNQSDLMESNEYEDEDISLFSSSDNVESTFNNDIDNELSFETEEKEDIIIPDEEAVPEPIEEPTPEPIPEPVEEVKPKRGRRKKVVEEPAPEPVVEEPVQAEETYSTMIFDTEKLNSELEEIDNMDKANINTTPEIDNRLDIFGQNFGASEPEPATSESAPVVSEELEPEDYSAPVYDIDEKIEALDDDVPTQKNEEESVDGPFKPAENEAESFMNELKRMKESAEADDFVGFAVETKSEELKEIHKKYTKKKSASIEEDNLQISFIPAQEKNEEPKKDDVDMNFLAQMEKNLKESQKERLTKKTTKKKKDNSED